MDEQPQPRFFHRTPVNVNSWEGEPAGNTIQEALTRVLNRFGRDTHLHSSRLFAPVGDDEISGSVLLIQTSPGHVLVVGVSSMAASVRGLLESTDEAIGWRMHMLPPGHTPIHTLKSHLDPRWYNTLTWNGFATVEQVAAVPEDAWLELPKVGPKFIKALRRIRANSSEPTAQAADPRETDDRRMYLLGRLEHVSQLRYGQFVDLLAASRIPPSALDKICATLNEEPLPLVDPTVVLLLETAGDQPLINYYLSTHSTTNPNPSQPPMEPVDNGDAPSWTVDLAEEILREALPKGSTFLRALVDEGGTATAARLKELTNSDALHYMTLTLTSAARKVLSNRNFSLAHRHFFRGRRDPSNPSSATVYDYVLPSELVPVFDEALRRLDR